MYTHRKVRSPENAADARVLAQSERCRFFGNTTLAITGINGPSAGSLLRGNVVASRSFVIHRKRVFFGDSRGRGPELSVAESRDAVAGALCYGYSGSRIFVGTNTSAAGNYGSPECDN
jgi:hypothetical protein